MDPITTITADALAGLPSQYAGKPFIAGLVSAIADEVQRIETAREELAQAALLPNASGVWLANLEAIVGAPATGGTDAERRAVVAAQGVVNHSHTAAADLRAALQALGLWWSLDTQRAGWVQVEGPAPAFPTVATIYRLIKAATAAGCGLSVVLDLGELLRDGRLRELGTSAWAPVGTPSAAWSVSKSEGVLRIEGSVGDTLANVFRGVAGGSYVLSGEYRGTLHLEFENASGGLLGAVGPSEDWLPFSLPFVAGAAGSAASAPAAVVGWAELRALRITPAGRSSRSLRFRSAIGGQHQADANGWGSAVAVASRQVGGLAAHRRTA